MLSLPDTVSPFHTTIFWLSLVLSLAFAWAARFTRVNKFLASAILFLVINAAVCGALAGVYDRYQSRVAWIIPFCLITYICNLIAERRRGVARQNSPALASFDLIG